MEAKAQHNSRNIATVSALAEPGFGSSGGKITRIKFDKIYKLVFQLSKLSKQKFQWGQSILFEFEFLNSL